jgi:acyl carrier protein
LKPLNKTLVISVISEAVAELNEQRRRSEQLVDDPTTLIVGADSQLDSLGFVNLIFALEQKIEDSFDTSLALSDELVLDGDQSAFQTLGALAEFVHSMLDRKMHG